MDEHSIRYPGDAIARICNEYKLQKENEWSIGYISNSADKNTQIIIEIIKWSLL